MKLSIVLSTHETGFDALAYTGDFARNLERISALGYDGVELAVRDPGLVEPGGLAEIIDRHGLAVPAIGTGQAYGEDGLSLTDFRPHIREQAVQRIQAHVDLAARFDAAVIIGLVRGRIMQGINSVQVREWLKTSLSLCLDHAGKKGVRLVLEPINRYETDLLNTVDETLEFLEEAGITKGEILFDTFHANIEEASLEASIRRAAGNLGHVHTADSNRRAPGDGHLDFAALVRVLKEVGYRGFLSAEILPLPDPDTSARRTIEHLRPLVSS